MQESTPQVNNVTANEQAVGQAANSRSLEERVAALEAEVTRIKEELRITSLQATSYRPDDTIVPGT